MTDIKLIHKSKVYADRILASVMGEQSINEDTIRHEVFSCWVDAYQAGFEAALKLPPNREDMGR